MSVIGRLDEQVDEIIIKPVSRRRRDGGEPPEQPQPPPDPAPQNFPRDERTDDPDELPVWLL